MLALTAAAAFSGIGLGGRSCGPSLCQGSAAGRRAYNWTGFYIFGGGGGGLWSGRSARISVTGTSMLRSPSISARAAAGWFGTVGIGYDWQFNGTWVAGMFGDGQFGSIRGTLQRPGRWAGPAR